jgi:hypothetical protein
MKPIAQSTDRQSDEDFSSSRRFPVTDFNYQSFSPDRFNGGSGRSPSPSFFDISRNYFQREARRNFQAEVVFFLIMVAILASAFIEGARLVIHVLQLCPP